MLDCWGFNGKFIHKTIGEIWEDYGLDPIYPTHVIESVYTFTPLLTKSTENDSDEIDDSDKETGSESVDTNNFNEKS